MGLASVASDCTFLSPYLAFDAIFFSMYKLSISPKRSWGSFVNASFFCTGAKKNYRNLSQSEKSFAMTRKAMPGKRVLPKWKIFSPWQTFLAGQKISSQREISRRADEPNYYGFHLYKEILWLNLWAENLLGETSQIWFLWTKFVRFHLTNSHLTN